MRKQHLFVCALVALAALFFPSMSRADGVTLVIDTSNLTGMEGNTLTVVFTLTNGTASDVAINNFAGVPPALPEAVTLPIVSPTLSSTRTTADS